MSTFTRYRSLTQVSTEPELTKTEYRKAVKAGRKSLVAADAMGDIELVAKPSQREAFTFWFTGFYYPDIPE